jgi:3-methyl-2-oxobutanoate hydroxymethyltransferase
LVWHDILGITQDMKPRFVKRYADLHGQILDALKSYKDEVENGKFPLNEHSFTMKEEDIPKLY